MNAMRAWKYQVPKESSLGWFLAISLMLFASAFFLTVVFPPKDTLPPMIEVDLGIEGVENEPPPLGEPEAGAGEVKPEPPPEPEMKEPQPVPEPEPEPIPEEPVVVPQEPTPKFVVPEETPPPPPPKPVVKSQPKPKRPDLAELRTQPAAPAGSGITNASAGVRGSPGGVVGGQGGGRGDFISTPHPQYNSTARQRRYEGRGVFLITYLNGRIISVEAIQSTGVPYLDARTIAHVKTRYRVKPGVSGSARLPISWQLR
jgi:periplasmic protein TonB